MLHKLAMKYMIIIITGLYSMTGQKRNRKEFKKEYEYEEDYEEPHKKQHGRCSVTLIKKVAGDSNKIKASFEECVKLGIERQR